MRAALMSLLVLALPAQAAPARLLIDVIECESGGHHRDKRGQILEGDDGKSIGIAQFQRRTFDWLKVKAKHPEWRHSNPIHQLRLLNWALDNGYSSHWTCWRKLKGEAQ